MGKGRNIKRLFFQIKRIENLKSVPSNESQFYLPTAMDNGVFKIFALTVKLFFFLVTFVFTYFFPN